MTTRLLFFIPNHLSQTYANKNLNYYLLVLGFLFQIPLLFKNMVMDLNGFVIPESASQVIENSSSENSDEENDDVAAANSGSPLLGRRLCQPSPSSPLSSSAQPSFFPPCYARLSTSQPSTLYPPAPSSVRASSPVPSSTPVAGSSPLLSGKRKRRPSLAPLNQRSCRSRLLDLLQPEEEEEELALHQITDAEPTGPSRILRNIFDSVPCVSQQGKGVVVEGAGSPCSQIIESDGESEEGGGSCQTPAPATGGWSARPVRSPIFSY
jgi:hypothetical protein